MGEKIYTFIFKNNWFMEFFERNIHVHVYAIQILTKSYE